MLQAGYSDINKQLWRADLADLVRAECSQGQGRLHSRAGQIEDQGWAEQRASTGHEVKEHNGALRSRAGHLLLGCRAMFDRIPPHSHTSFCSGSLSRRPSDSTSVR